MKCPHLSKTHVFTCTANGHAYTPSPFELEEFCLSKKCKMCPFPALMKFGIARAGDGKTGARKLTAQLEAVP